MTKTQLILSKLRNISVLVSIGAFAFFLIAFSIAIINNSVAVVNGKLESDYSPILITLTVLFVVSLIIARIADIILEKESKLMDVHEYRQSLKKNQEVSFSQTKIYSDIIKTKKSRYTEMSSSENEEEEITEEKPTVKSDLEKRIRDSKLSFFARKKLEQSMRQEETASKALESKENTEEKSELKEIIEEAKKEPKKEKVEELKEEIVVTVKGEQPKEQKVEEPQKNIKEEVIIKEEKIVEKPQPVEKKKEVVSPPKITKVKTVTKTKADFIELISASGEISKNKSNKFLTAFSKVIIEQLIKGEEIELTGLGKMVTIVMPAKEAVNPQTKKKIIVPEHRQVRMRFLSEFKDQFK